MISTFFYALSMNLDLLFIGICFGLQGILFSKRDLIIAGVITFVSTYIGIFAGQLLYPSIPASLRLMGSILFLIVLSLHSIRKGLLGSLKRASIPCCPRQSQKHSIFMILPLSLNNLCLGISGEFVGYQALPMVLCTLGSSFLLMPLGLYLGKAYRLKLPMYLSDLISGALLLLLSIYFLYECLHS